MAFDVDAFREAHRPWTFRVGGVVWMGRHVSASQCAAYDQQIARAENERDRTAAYRWILRRAFPWRFSYLLRGDPVRVLLELEPPARAEALRHFFACLRGETPPPPQQRTTVARSQRPTSGTPSPAPTPHLTH